MTHRSGVYVLAIFLRPYRLKESLVYEFCGETMLQTRVVIYRLRGVWEQITPAGAGVIPP
jgi:hypothetical protein